MRAETVGRHEAEGPFSNDFYSLLLDLVALSSIAFETCTGTTK